MSLFTGTPEKSKVFDFIFCQQGMPKNLQVSDEALVLLRPRITFVLSSKYPH